jgi:hypothetical protein
MEPVITVVAEPFVDPETPTLTEYQKVARDLMTALDAFANVIPKLEESEAVDAKQVRRNLNVPDVFCYTAITAAEQLEELDGVQQHTGRGRNRLQYLEAFRPLDDKLDVVSRRLKHGLYASKSAVAGDALEIYRVAKAKNKSSRNPALAVHVKAMKRDLAKLSITKAERAARRAARFQEAVEKELQKRRIQEALAAQRQKEEVKNA